MDSKVHIENQLSKIIVDSAFKVHSELGPGLLEKTYKECLFYELERRGLSAEKEKYLPLKYEELEIKNAYRVDLFIENKVIVELKATDDFTDIHIAQILTYLKLSGCKLSLLINFNKKRIKDGIKRIIL